MNTNQHRNAEVGHELAAPIAVTTAQEKCAQVVLVSCPIILWRPPRCENCFETLLLPVQKANNVRPTPAHFMMTAHALTFGLLSATSKVVSGESKGWSQVMRVNGNVSLRSTFCCAPVHDSTFMEVLIISALSRISSQTPLRRPTPSRPSAAMCSRPPSNVRSDSGFRKARQPGTSMRC
jgi:hypothetical protein